MQTLAYLLARFSEPSSYAGLGAVLALIGWNLPEPGARPADPGARRRLRPARFPAQGTPAQPRRAARALGGSHRLGVSLFVPCQPLFERAEDRRRAQLLGDRLLALAHGIVLVQHHFDEVRHGNFADQIC